jgi:asparagine synthase (glutamine-hydrolysing)
MCGIVGIASRQGSVDADRLLSMRDAIRHRGPDDAGLWRASDGRVGLAQCRLAVIDLVHGHQPMTDPAGECQLVFNGELYNYRELRDELAAAGHRFRTSSDSEVLLASYGAWGTDCLARLNGMFAFAIYDPRYQRLFAARDRAGEKPFYYREDGDRLAFASEIKALLADPACPRRLDPAALDWYLAYGYTPPERSMLQGVRKLPPAHALEYDLRTSRLRQWQYWSLPEPEGDAARVTPAGVCDEALLEELERLLLDSVRLRLVADVPVGILLSGGLDSSLVTAMAARLRPRIRTFTIAFSGHAGYDESPHARAVADHFGTDHVVLEAEPASIDLLPRLARQFDEPLADSSMVPTYLVSRLIRGQATVALGGDGGDELFGGYLHHTWVQQQHRIRRLLPGRVTRLARPLVRRCWPVGARGRNFALGLTGDEAFSLAQFNQLFDPSMRRKLLRHWRSASPALAEREKQSSIPAGLTPLQRVTTMDFRTYLPEDILVKVDRASMLASLEVRAPWLDHRLIEFAFRRVPDRLRATTRERKILPRRLAARLLPGSLDLQRKQGFSLPLGAWLRGEWGDVVQQVLTDPGQPLFDRQTIAGLLAAHRHGLTNEHRLFALVMFELWRREYQVAVD